MITLGMACALATSLIALPDKITYERMLEIVRVEVSPAPGKEKRHRVEVTFNLIPDMPKGVKLQFELMREGIKVGKQDEAYVFTLVNESRKGCKLVFTPTERLTADNYFIMTRIPLADQTPEVRKAIEAKPSRFPPKESPWPFNYIEQGFKVGTAEDAAAEEKEIADFVQSRGEKLLELNNEAMEEIEKAKAGTLKPEALGKFLSSWVNRMAAVQSEISGFVEREPGLFGKFTRVITELAELGRMVGKRITKTELAEVLKKNNLQAGAVKVPTASGFDNLYHFGNPGPAQLKRRWETIQRILDPNWKPDDAEGGAEEATGKEGKAAEEDKPKDEGAGPEKKDAKDETPPPDPKKAEKAKPSKTSKTSKKKTDQKKPAGKKDEE